MFSRKVNFRSLVRILFRHRLKVLVSFAILVFLFFTTLSYWKISRHHGGYKSSSGHEPWSSKESSEKHFPDISSKHDSVFGHCNHPERIQIRDEVISDSIRESHNLELRAVFVLTRHGDRGPLRPVRNLDKVDFDPLDESSDFKIPIDNKVVQVFHHFNETVHKTRRSNLAKDHLKTSSFAGFSLVPRSRGLMGQLSVLGFLQHLHQGREVAKVYLTHLQKWLTNKTPHGVVINNKRLDLLQRIEVFTTNYQRTYQSAVGFLAGLLSRFEDDSSDQSNTHKTMEEIVHAVQGKIKGSQGNFFCSSPSYCIKCRRHNELDQKIESFKQDALSMHPAVKDLMNRVIEIMSEKPSSTQDSKASREGASKDAIFKSSRTLGQIFTSVESVLDGLMSYLCHSADFPCDEVNESGTSKRCIYLSDPKRLWHFLINRNQGLMSNPHFLMSSVLKIQGFLEHLNSRFTLLSKETTADSSQPIFSLFSGHDITVVPAALVLGFWDGGIPPYATRLVFEVYHKKISTSSNLETYIRIVFNGKDITKNTEICKHKKNPCVVLSSHSTDNHIIKSVTLIPVKEFDSFITRRFSAIANTDNFEEACYSSNDGEQKDFKSEKQVQPEELASDEKASL